MPPWFADPHYGKFANDARCSRRKSIPSLPGSTAEHRKAIRKTCRRRASSPMAGPSPNPMPSSNCQPLSRSRPPASIEYQHILIPAPFKTDKWVQFAEARPTDRSRVHHIIAFIREPGSDWLKDAKPGIPFVPEKPKADDRTRHQRAAQRLSGRLRARPAARKASSRDRPNSSAPAPTSFCRFTTPPTESQARTAAASAWSSPKSRRASACSRYRPPTASSKFRPALPIIAWTRSSNWAPPSPCTACIRTCTAAAKISSTASSFPGGETRTLLNVPNYRATGSSGTN